MTDAGAFAHGAQDRELDMLPMPVVDRIGRQDFVTQFERPGLPVVVRQASETWRATREWSYDYMAERIGDHDVPLCRTGTFLADQPVNAAHASMTFRDYANLVQTTGTDLRIFLLNPFEIDPTLLDDFAKPEMAGRTLGRFPMLFFASAGARVFLHFDIDMSHVFHTQFGGRKRVCLFAPDYSVPLYRVPLSVRSFMEIDPEQPDYDVFPALRFVRGYTALLEHGDTLYIPPGWWHQMHYLDTGFGLSQRCLNRRVGQQIRAAGNLFLVKPIEGGVRRIGAQRWADFKDRWAVRRAERYAERHSA